MNFFSFLYYGYDKKTRAECLDLIRATNRNHSQILNLWFAALMLILAVFAHNELFFVDKNNERLYVCYFAAALVCCVVQAAFRDWSKKRAIFMAYVNVAMMISYSIFAAIYQPYMAATTMLVMLVLLSVAYIDTMFTMIPVLMLSTGLFIFFSWTVKPLNIWYQDVYNVLIFFSLSAVLHYSFQRSRMEQFATYLENVRIQRDLEVRSSFDALTSLLNRGRFFSMAAEVLRAPHDEYMAFCIMDLDFFKEINDVLGHQMGDKAIQIAGQTLLAELGVDYKEKWSFQERAIQERLTLAGRLGGDEFIALIRGKKSKAEIEDALQKIIDSLNKTNFGRLQGIRASIGAVEVGADDHDIDRLYNLADGVLYASKKSGKNRVTFADN